MSDTNPAVDPPVLEKARNDTGEDNREAAKGLAGADVASAPALQRRDSGGTDTMS